MNLTFGEWLRHTRNTVIPLSLRELAKAVDISPSYLSDIEHDRRVPGEEVLHELADALGIPREECIARSGRLGYDTERYLRVHPNAVRLMRRIAQDGLSEAELALLLDIVDRARHTEAILQPK